MKAFKVFHLEERKISGNSNELEWYKYKMYMNWLQEIGNKK